MLSGALSKYQCLQTLGPTIGACDTNGTSDERPHKAKWNEDCETESRGFELFVILLPNAEPSGCIPGYVVVPIGLPMGYQLM